MAARASEPRIEPGRRYPTAAEHAAWEAKVKAAEDALRKIHADIAAEQAAREELLQDLADVERLTTDKEEERGAMDDALQGIWRSRQDSGIVLTKEH